MALACGIDFGTSNTLAGVATPDGVTLCRVDPPNADPQLLPSLLYFSRYGWQRVGREATFAYQHDPDGRFVRALKGALPEHDPEERFRMFKQPFTLSGLVRLVLERVRERLEVELGEEVREAVLGRPVRFSPDPETDARAEGILREAAEAAGFRSVRFLTEPEAATRYYFSVAAEEARLPAGRTVMVFDFGGGTLDLCLARFGSDGYRVLGTSGVAIGGTLLDRILFEKKLLKHLGYGARWGRGLELPASIFNRLVNPDANWKISEGEYALEVRTILNHSIAGGTAFQPLRQFHAVVQHRLGPDLFAAIEAAKVCLSRSEKTQICFSAPGVEIREPLSRDDLRTLFAAELEAIRRLVGRTLAEARLEPRDVDRVLLAGGSSALVCTQELLREIFGPERVPLRQDLFTSIVSGLALEARATRAEAPTPA